MSNIFAYLYSVILGIKKHFEVAAILDNYHEVTGKCMSSETIWKFLPTLLNIDLLVSCRLNSINYFIIRFVACDE